MLKRTLLFTILSSIMISSNLALGADKSKSLIAKGAKLEKLCDGFSFTEGPAADKSGNVYFTDQPNNKILIWTIDGKLLVFSDNSGRSNGLYFDKEGKLWACADMNDEIWSFDSEGNHTAFISDGYMKKRFNGPNDLWIHPNGSIYFTDPYYKRPYWTHNGEKQQDSEQVYCLSSDRKTVVRLTNDLERPNGIIGTPDGKLLYVADIKAGKTWQYNIQSDGTLTGKKLFAEMGSDGMTIDQKGNIYLTGEGVTIFNKKGKKIAHIPVEAKWSANICFGGKDHQTLFITASESLFSIRMKVKGCK